MHPDIRLVYPHEMCSEEPESHPSHTEPLELLYPKALASTYGNLVHKALEISAQDISSGREVSLPWGRLWKELRSAGIGLGMSPKELDRVQDLLVKEVTHTLDHPEWNRLVRKARLVETELGVVHRISEFRLMRGVVDLVTHHPWDGASYVSYVVDYKTTTLPPSVCSPEALGDFCAEAGYFRQLNFYVQALQKIDPDHSYQGIIWFTKIAATSGDLTPAALFVRVSER